MKQFRFGLLLVLMLVLSGWVPTRPTSAEMVALQEVPFLSIATRAANPCGTITVAGNTAFLPDGNNKLWILDVVSPGVTGGLSYVTVPGFVYEVKVVGNYAFAVMSQNVYVIDFTNRYYPVVVDNYLPTVAGGITGIDIVGNYVYLAVQSDGLEIVNAADITNLSYVSSYQFSTAAPFEKVQVVNNLAYVAASDAGLLIIDVANPAAPTLVGQYDTAGSAKHTRINGTTVYIADYDRGITLVDVANPANPTLITTFDTADSQDYMIFLRFAGDQLYVVTVDSLLVVNINTLPRVTVAARYDPEAGETYSSLQIVGDVVYLTDMNVGLYTLQRRPQFFNTHFLYVPLVRR